MKNFVQHAFYGVSYVEKKINANKAQCIVFDPSIGTAKRTIVDVSSYTAITTLIERDRDIERAIRMLDLSFRVLAIDKSSRITQESSISNVLNSVIPLNSIYVGNGKEVIYRLTASGRSYHIVESEVQYVPNLYTTNDIDSYPVGSVVEACASIPHHNLFVGEEYLVRSIMKNPDELLYGSIYLENIRTKERLTTYTKFVKLKITKENNVQSF